MNNNLYNIKNLEEEIPRKHKRKFEKEREQFVKNYDIFCFDCEGKHKMEGSMPSTHFPIYYYTCPNCGAIIQIMRKRMEKTKNEYNI